jgi:hypothetical protein
MHKTFLGFLSFVFSFNLLWCQDNISLSGYILDAQTGEKLIGAYIIDPNSNIHASTNNFGLFSLSAPQGSYSFSLSYVGYKPGDLNITLTNDTLIQIELTTDSQLQEVVVTAENPDRIQSLNTAGLKNLPLKMIKQLPVIMGERDVLKTIQLLPGIQSGSEANTGLYVRGGESDQNLILLDGAEVFNPNHLFGFFSLFNDDAIKSVKVYTSGFPSQYNSRLASVVDIRMKDGNSFNTKVKGSIGLISSKFQIEGPLVKEKLTYIVSLRRTYLDLFARPIIKRFTSYSDAGYYFLDMNARISWKINNRNNIYLSNYAGQDKGHFETNSVYGINPPEKDMAYTAIRNKQDINWGNNLLIFRYEHLFSTRLFMNLKTSLSDYKYHSFDYNLNQNIYWQGDVLLSKKSEYSFRTNSNIKKLSSTIEFEHFVSNTHNLSYGIGAESYILNPSIENFSVGVTGSQNQQFKVQNYFSYFEDEINLWDKLLIKPGLNFSLFFADKAIPKLSKRLSISYQATQKLKIHASYSEMSQFLHLLTLARINLASDLWLSSSDGIKPAESIDKSIGFSFPFLKGFSINADIYSREYKNLLAYKEGLSFTSHYNNYSEMVTSGTGNASGVEINFEKSSGSVTGMVSYCYSISTRHFQEINQGQTFRAQYDRPHNFKIMAIKNLGEKWSFGMVFNLMSGSVQTMGSGRYINWFDYGENPYDNLIYQSMTKMDVVLYKKNSYRLPVYHRLDVSITYNIEKRKHKSSVNFGLYNAYNAKNTYMSQMELVFLENEKYAYKIINKTLFPIIPFLSYNFEF